MNFTKALTMILAGMLAVSPMQYTNGEIVNTTEDVVEEVPVTEEAAPEAIIVAGNSAIGGFSFIINQYYESKQRSKVCISS